MLDQILNYIPMVVQWGASQYPAVMFAISAAGSLMVLATVYVKFTPSQADDAALEELEKKSWFKMLKESFERFSLISRK